MEEWLKVVFISAICFGTWTCMNLWVNSGTDKMARRVLSVFILLLLVPPMDGYLRLVIAVEYPPLLSALRGALTWFYGPLVLLLVRLIVLKHVDATSLVRHLLGAGLIALAATFGNLFNTAYFLLLAVTGQVLLYFGLAMKELYGNRRCVQRLNRDFKKSTYYWLQYVVLGLFALCLLDLMVWLAITMGMQLKIIWLDVLACGFVLYSNTIVLVALFTPESADQEEWNSESVNRGRPGNMGEGVPLVSFSTAKAPAKVEASSSEDGSPSLHETESDRRSGSVANIEADNNSNVRNLQLTEVAASQLAEKLVFIMEQEKPHLNAEEGLGSMSARLGITSHALSELLNMHLGTSFYEWMNLYRYYEAVHYLEDSTETYSVTDIAYRSGFNNRNSFYRVFKQHTGTTPTQFRKLGLKTTRAGI